MRCLIIPFNRPASQDFPWTHRIDIGPDDGSTIWFGAYGTGPGDCINQAIECVSGWKNLADRLEAMRLLAKQASVYGLGGQQTLPMEVVGDG